MVGTPLARYITHRLVGQFPNFGAGVQPPLLAEQVLQGLQVGAGPVGQGRGAVAQVV
jgi:hypothetical protein